MSATINVTENPGTYYVMYKDEAKSIFDFAYIGYYNQVITIEIPYYNAYATYDDFQDELAKFPSVVAEDYPDCFNPAVWPPDPYIPT
tara:strand:- start:335 stop:595 length:261 start_codon:yes stop_codon:yes gene_type:complete